MDKEMVWTVAMTSVAFVLLLFSFQSFLTYVSHPEELVTDERFRLVAISNVHVETPG
jgi:hypothetical protein